MSTKTTKTNDLWISLIVVCICMGTIYMHIHMYEVLYADTPRKSVANHTNTFVLEICSYTYVCA